MSWQEAQTAWERGDWAAVAKLAHEGLHASPTEAEYHLLLRAIRSKVDYPPDLSPPLIRGWQHWASGFDLCLIALFGTVLTALGLIARRHFQSRYGLALLGGAACIWFVLIWLTVAIYREREADRARPIAVVRVETIARQGNGSRYPQALSQSLLPGTEVRIISERGGWVQFMIPDGTAWLPEEHILRPRTW
ncbi:MAG: hypothetical protein ACRC8S_05695 [Fimbriiglobus sp.]